MLTPSQLDHYPDSLVELYAQVEADILADMARKINSTNYYTAASQWQRQKLHELGNTYDDIMKRLSAVSGKSKEELRRIMQEAGTEALKNDDDIYKAAGLSPGNVNQSPALLNVLNAGLKKTKGTFDNLTKTTANTATKQFEHALDRAYMQITTGAFSPQVAIKIAIKDLAKDGLNAIEYPSGHIDHLDVAVRRAVITGVNQTAATLQVTRAGEMGCDLVEVTAHAGARPSHAVWQGGIYSLSGQSKEYAGLEEATGYGTGAGLCGWNCRHSFFPYYPGISRPAYTPEELEQFNAKTYEYNGIKMTEYEATQKQRYIERQIRRWKREEQAMNAAGLPTEEAKAKVARWKAVQKDYLRKTGLKRQYDREWIAKMPDNVPNMRRSDLSKNTERRYSKQEIDELAKLMNDVANRHMKNASMWNGEIIIDNDNRASKLWSCAIRVPEITTPHEILHEMLHAHSASYYGKSEYVRYRAIEEASVQLLNIEISRKEGIEVIISGYDDMVNKLKEINTIAQLQTGHYEFAIELLSVPLPERFEWLNEQISAKLDLTLSKRMELQKMLEVFEEDEQTWQIVLNSGLTP